MKSVPECVDRDSVFPWRSCSASRVHLSQDRPACFWTKHHFSGHICATDKCENISETPSSCQTPAMRSFNSSTKLSVELTALSNCYFLPYSPLSCRKESGGTSKACLMDSPNWLFPTSAAKDLSLLFRRAQDALKRSSSCPIFVLCAHKVHFDLSQSRLRGSFTRLFLWLIQQCCQLGDFLTKSGHFPNLLGDILLVKSDQQQI